MNIKYTDHSLARLRKRAISKKEVEEAVNKGRKEATRNGLRKSTHRNQKGILVVIYSAEGPREILIITTYWAQ